MKFRITYVILALVAVVVVVGVLFYIEDTSFHVNVSPEYVEETFHPIGYKYVIKLSASNDGPLPMSAVAYIQVGYLNETTHGLTLENYTIPIHLNSGQRLQKTITVYLNVSDEFVNINGNSTVQPVYSMPQIEEAMVEATGTYGWSYKQDIGLSSRVPSLFLTQPSPPDPIISSKLSLVPNNQATFGEKLTYAFNNTKEIYYPNTSSYFVFMSMTYQKYSSSHIGYITFPPGYYNVTFHLYNQNISRYFNFSHVTINPGTSFSVPYPASGVYNMTVTVQGNGVQYTWEFIDMTYQP